MIYARIEFFAANAGEDDQPIRTRRVVGSAGSVALAIGEAIHQMEGGETVDIAVEPVEEQEG